MQERHEHEQYFFAPPTVHGLATFLASYSRPACLCTPMVGALLAQRGHPARILEIDERFAATSGFVRFDLYRPHTLDERFDLILCDPPFEKVGLAQLFAAVRVLAHGSFAQPLLLCYPSARAGALLGTFAPFGLTAIDAYPRYVSVQAHGPQGIRLYGNLGQERHAQLQRALQAGA